MQVQNSRTLSPEDFDIDPSTGELVLVGDGAMDGEEEGEDFGTEEDLDRSEELAVVTSSSVDSLGHTPPAAVDLSPSGDSLSATIEQAAQGRKTESIILYKAENSSLGFGVVGLRSEYRGELGIFVQDIQPGGVAAR